MVKIPGRARCMQRLKVLRLQKRRKRQQQIRLFALQSRHELWHLPAACHDMEEAQTWRHFFAKLVRKFDLRVKVLASRVKRWQQKQAAFSWKPRWTPEEERMVNAALDQQQLAESPEEVLCTRFGAPLTRRHLSCLQPDEWLNDEVVNCYLRLLQDQNSGTLWCPSTFFWPKLEESGHQAVQRWTKRAGLNVGALRTIVVPLHLDDSHWALGAVHVEEREVSYLDSLGKAAPDALVSRLSEFMEGEARSNSSGDVPAGSWKLKPRRCSPGSVPLQQNFSDCGVFMLAYAECVAALTPISFDTSPEAIAEKRRSVALAILKGCL
eukprot:gb/GFBE01016616.1/.p1 GENE.gb/GFBE01016616.1/~~gb/GFBE01016616.1/.p1  ORF type:complete len:323 (+),score=65.37 gb/GFBE01016616.1/:1-969(+)